MIVRARAKDLEDFPPALVCCDLTRRNIARCAGEIVRVDTTTAHPYTLTCKGCGVEHRGQIVEIITDALGGYGQAFIEALDLDEGAL